MKGLISRIILPKSQHSNPHVEERVKITLLDGYYIFERTPTKWSVVEEQRYITQEQLEVMLNKWEEEKQFPGDIPSAIEALFLKLRKTSGSKEKAKIKMILQTWIHELEILYNVDKLYNAIV